MSCRDDRRELLVILPQPSFAPFSSAVRFCTLPSGSSRVLLTATPGSHAPGDKGRGSPSRLRVVNGAFGPY